MADTSSAAVTGAMGMFVLAWLAGPVVIYRDLKAMGWADGSQAGAVVWSLLALALVILVPAFYLYKRVSS